MSVQVRCPAKVNLHLEVRGKRPDGYHELRTLFAAVGVWDELTCEPAPDGALELAVEPPGVVSTGEDNLVLRAARALASHGAVSSGARIRLCKAIPVAGGLGGGSADAAAALVALAELWGIDRSFRTLHPVAAALGADVPFFLLGGVAWGVGRGSEVYPLPDLPAWWAVLLPGPQPISTAEVYGALTAEELDASPPSEVYQWVAAGGELPLGCCRNDLQPTVTQRWPEVGERLQKVRATRPLLSLLSGSGGTVFGLYADAARARQAAENLGGDRLLVAPLLGRSESLPRPSAA